jgi:hypothetical protein
MTFSRGLDFGTLFTTVSGELPVHSSSPEMAERSIAAV